VLQDITRGSEILKIMNDVKILTGQKELYPKKGLKYCPQADEMVTNLVMEGDFNIDRTSLTTQS
jgi:hypothetical protein